ncbi:MAG TPA: ABC transporter ATP-binding protein [Candidatus Eisenbacteria bacterium]
MTNGLVADLALSMDHFSLDARLTVSRNETLALLGPNGAGKTTALDLIAGLRSPDRGRIELDGTVLCDTSSGIDLPPEARRVGLVFQDYALFPHRTVRGNVAYGPVARNLPQSRRAAVTVDCLERLGLTPLADRPVTELSGGQRQRVALARALAADARVLLLDEPFASLDATHRAQVRFELRTFLHESGLPAIVVTHDLGDAVAVADRLVILEAGRIVQSGTPAEIVEAPTTPFIADLVASMDARSRSRDS